MILGMRPRKGGWTMAGRGGTGAVAANLAAWGSLIAIAVMLSLLLAGCGGGGSSSSSSGASGTPTPAAGNVTVTGTLLDQYSGTGAANAVVAFGKYYALSGTGGAFSLSIPPKTSGSLIVYGQYTLGSSGTPVLGSNGIPTSNGFYYDTGLYNGSYISLGVTGIPIPATASNQTITLTAITLLSTNGPPPPPQNF